MADETLPIRIVETPTTTNEAGQLVSVRPARYVDAEMTEDEAGNAIATVPFEEVAGLITLNSASQAVPVVPVRIVDGLTALNETNSPVSVIALRGVGSEPPDPTPPGVRNAPTLGLADNTTYPPPLTAAFDASVYQNDVLRVQASATVDFASPFIDETAVLDAAAIASGEIDIPGLSDIDSPDETFFRARIEPPSLAPSDWSAIVKHGDVTAPTITSGSSLTEEEGVTDPTGTLTADEPVTWMISGGADAGLFTVDPDTGVWEIPGTTDYGAKPSYAVQFRATDFSGNFAVQDFTYAVTEIPSGDPTAWNPAQKHMFVSLSNSDLTATGTDGVGAPCPVLALGGKTTGKHVIALHVQIAGEFTSLTLGFANTLTPQYVDPGSTDDAISYARSSIVRYDNNILGSWSNGEGTDPEDLDYVVWLAVDADAGLSWPAKDGVWTGNPAAGTGGFFSPIGTFIPFAAPISAASITIVPFTGDLPGFDEWTA